MVEMNAKLEAALTAKQESEARAVGLDEKVKTYEAELNTIKGNVSCRAQIAVMELILEVLMFKNFGINYLSK